MSEECENKNSNEGDFTLKQIRQLQALIVLMSSNTPGSSEEREVSEAESSSKRDSSLSLNSF